MPLVVPEDFASVIHSLRWTSDPEPMAITYGVGIDAGSPPGTAGLLADDLAQAFIDNILSTLSVQIELIQTEVSWQTVAPPAPPVIGTSSLTGPGDEVGNVLPQNSALLIHKRTGIGGRGGRGRLYMPGAIEAEVDNLGNVAGAEITQWNTQLGLWLTDIAAITGVTAMVVFHNDPGAFSAEPPYAVTTLNLDAVIATQRRRLRR